MIQFGNAIWRLFSVAPGPNRATALAALPHPARALALPASLAGGGSSGATASSSSGAEPIPEPCGDCEPGGGGEFGRSLILTVVDVTPSNPTGNVLFSRTLSGASFVFSDEPALEHMGLAFGPNSDLLYIAGPDTDELFVYDTTATPITQLPSIPVGDKPSDVAIVKADIDGDGIPDEDRAYVTNELGNSVSVIRVSDNSVRTTRILPQTGSNPVAIATRSDGSSA